MLVGACLRAGRAPSRSLPLHERRALGQAELGDEAAHHLARQRALAHVRRQPARVLHHQRDLPCVPASPRRCVRPPRARARACGEISACHTQPSWESARAPSRGRRGGGFENAWKRFQPPISTRSELRMVERLPRDVTDAAELLVAPAEELQVVLDRMVAEPVDVLVVGDAGLAHRRPDLDDPGEHAEMLVDPVERAADHRPSGGSGTRDRRRCWDSR